MTPSGVDRDRSSDPTGGFGHALTWGLVVSAGVVLVLGKGHEQGQDFGDRVVPFDDATVAREEAARR